MIIYNIYKTIIIIIPPISVVVFLKRLLDGYFFKLPKYFQDSWRTSWCNLCNKKKKPPVSRSLYKYKNYEWFFIITSIVYPLNSSEYTLQYIYRYIKEGNFWKSYNNVNSIYAHVLFGSWTFYSCFYIRIHTLTHTPIVVYLYIHTHTKYTSFFKVLRSNRTSTTILRYWRFYRQFFKSNETSLTCSKIHYWVRQHEILFFVENSSLFTRVRRVFLQGLNYFSYPTFF